MDVNKLSKLIESVDDVLGDDADKDALKSVLINQALNKGGKSGLLGKLLGSGVLSGDSALTKNWRPFLVLGFSAILINNYLVYPYLHLMIDGAPYFQLDKETVHMLGGFLMVYAGGRSAEKVFEIKNNLNVTKE